MENEKVLSIVEEMRNEIEKINTSSDIAKGDEFDISLREILSDEEIEDKETAIKALERAYYALKLEEIKYLISETDAYVKRGFHNPFPYPSEGIDDV